MDLQRAFERMGPDVAQFVDRTIDYCAPLILDAEATIADDLSDVAGLHSTLSRSFEKASKRTLLDRYNRSGTAFAEEGVLGGVLIRSANVCTQVRRGRCRGETALSEGYREATITDVVGGAHYVMSCQSYETALKTLLGDKINIRRPASDDTGYCLGVFT